MGRAGYPEDIFTVQAEMYGTYHMEAPHELFRDREIEMVPYYVTAQLPGSGNPEFLLMLPMSVAEKNQMAGWERRRLVTADVAGEDAGLAALVLSSGMVSTRASRQIASLELSSMPARNNVPDDTTCTVGMARPSVRHRS
jgi:hypothetical protein